MTELTMTSRRLETVDAIERAGVVGIIRVSDPAIVQRLVDAFLAGGVRLLEITMTVPGATDLIRTLSAALPEGCLVGAGTVTSAGTAREVIDASARFVVSPVFRPAIVETCHELDTASLPGCFTPTEILGAWEAGADIVKVFPATVLGPGYFREIRGPMPQVKLMPTGGVTTDTAADWIRAGAVAVGIGAAVIDRAAVAAGNFEAVTTAVRRVVDRVAAAREQL